MEYDIMNEMLQKSKYGFIWFPLLGKETEVQAV